MWGASYRNSGCGWQWTVTPVRWWDLLVGTAASRQHGSCGSPCRESIANVQCATRFLGHVWLCIAAQTSSSWRKEAGQTNHIERLNNTLRQRISRLVRRALSFSTFFETIKALLVKRVFSGATYCFCTRYASVAKRGHETRTARLFLPRASINEVVGNHS